MVTHWLPLIGGLFFGLIPPRLLINSECRYLRFDKLWKRVVIKDTPDQRRRRWWKLPLVWIDPIRGFASGLFLGSAFEPVIHAKGFERLGPVLATAAALVLVLWIQTCGRIKDGETLSPTAFLGGMMLALLPPVVAIAAITIGVTTAIALGGYAAGYFMATLATMIIGYAFLGRSPWLGVYTLLVALPLILNWARRTALVMPMRC